MAIRKEAKLSNEQAELQKSMESLARAVPAIKTAKLNDKRIRSGLANLEKEATEIRKNAGYLNDNHAMARLTEIETETNTLRGELEGNKIDSAPIQLNKKIYQSLKNVINSGQSLPPAFNLQNFNTILQAYPDSVKQWIDLPGVLEHLSNGNSLEWQEFYKQLTKAADSKELDEKLHNENLLMIIGKMELHLKEQPEIMQTSLACQKIASYITAKKGEVQRYEDIKNEFPSEHRLEEAKYLIKNLGASNIDKKHMAGFGEVTTSIARLNESLENYEIQLGKIAIVERIPAKELEQELTSLEPSLELDDENSNNNNKNYSPPSIDYDAFNAQHASLHMQINESKKLPELENQKIALEKDLNERIDTTINKIDEQLANKNSNLHSHHFFRSKLITSDSTPIRLLKELKESLVNLKTSISPENQNLGHGRSNRNF